MKPRTPLVRFERATQDAGQVMRFITPVLVTVALYMLADIRGRVDSLTTLIPRVAVLEVQVKHLEKGPKNEVFR